MAVHMESFLSLLPDHEVTLIALENGVESKLLSGEIDLGFDGGRPYSPEITYKQVLSESISAVASPQLLKKYGAGKNHELHTLPYVFSKV